MQVEKEKLSFQKDVHYYKSDYTLYNANNAYYIMLAQEFLNFMVSWPSTL